MFSEVTEDGIGLPFRWRTSNERVADRQHTLRLSRAGITRVDGSEGLPGQFVAADFRPRNGNFPALCSGAVMECRRNRQAGPVPGWTALARTRVARENAGLPGDPASGASTQGCRHRRPSLAGAAHLFALARILLQYRLVDDIGGHIL